MIKILAHDITNDVTIIDTGFGLWVRYGLNQEPVDDINEAVEVYNKNVAHALGAKGWFVHD
ncbi:hypothetical protein [Roseibium alexandrii]|uniref:Uncharacterized protein n=1 Tax=Roseibium alexandrii (strain DSM 17067 / NCIMB 14079 / DFL-11) TaxID=244592 RepID=A0A5E8GSX8_ROSAD|nr:hypothetical protein [Roseibium alexandrii]EEE42848.1 hypothetical protein SADFL11_PLAS20 [Roseibium alexandrii DFL-11]